MDTSSNVFHYQVLWTSDKAKKVKVWKDGTMRFHSFNNRGILYDSDNRVVDDFFLNNKRIVLDSEIEFNRTIVYVENLQTTTEANIPPIPRKSKLSETGKRPAYLLKPFQPPFHSANSDVSNNSNGALSSNKIKTHAHHTNSTKSTIFRNANLQSYGVDDSDIGSLRCSSKHQLSVTPEMQPKAKFRPNSYLASSVEESNRANNTSPYPPSNSSVTALPKPSKIAYIPVLSKPKSFNGTLVEDPVEEFGEDDIASDFFSSPSADLEADDFTTLNNSNAGHLLQNLSNDNVSVSVKALENGNEEVSNNHARSPYSSRACNTIPSNKNDGLNDDHQRQDSSVAEPSPTSERLRLTRLPLPLLRKPTGKRQNFINITVTDPSKNLYERSVKTAAELASLQNVTETTDNEIPNSPDFLDAASEEDEHIPSLDSSSLLTPLALPNKKAFQPVKFRVPSFSSPLVKPASSSSFGRSHSHLGTSLRSNELNGSSASSSIFLQSNNAVNPNVSPSTVLEHAKHPSLAKHSGVSLRTGLLIYPKYANGSKRKDGFGATSILSTGEHSSLPKNSKSRNVSVFSSPFNVPSFTVSSSDQVQKKKGNVPNAIETDSSPSDTISSSPTVRAVNLSPSKNQKPPKILTKIPDIFSKAGKKSPILPTFQESCSLPIEPFSSNITDLPFVNTVTLASTSSKIKRAKLKMLKFKHAMTTQGRDLDSDEDGDFI